MGTGIDSARFMGFDGTICSISTVLEFTNSQYCPREVKCSDVKSIFVCNRTAGFIGHSPCTLDFEWTQQVAGDTNTH
jgi:hypothetical protein